MKDIFQSKADYIIIPVNMVKIMGAGIAKQFKEKYPQGFENYKTMEFTKENSVFPYFSLVFFATKYHWKDNSDIELIESGLIQLKKYIENGNLLSNHYPSNNPLVIAFPKVGCGLGNLDWSEVKPLIIKYLGDLVNLEFYE